MQLPSLLSGVSEFQNCRACAHIYLHIDATTANTVSNLTATCICQKHKHYFHKANGTVCQTGQVVHRPQTLPVLITSTKEEESLETCIFHLQNNQRPKGCSAADSSSREHRRHCQEHMQICFCKAPVETDRGFREYHEALLSFSVCCNTFKNLPVWTGHISHDYKHEMSN